VKEIRLDGEFPGGVIPHLIVSREEAFGEAVSSMVKR